MRSSSLGLLTHPYTSAGRIPTDSGYRFYAGEVLERQASRPERFPLDLTSMRSEVEAALQSTTEMLGQVTRLLALVSAPGHETATVRHVEVLLLQASVLMVVTITSAGGVGKKLVTFPSPVDPGLAAWANEYLNERLTGRPRNAPGASRSTTGPRSAPSSMRQSVRLWSWDARRAPRLRRVLLLLDDVRVDESEACRRLLSRSRSARPCSSR